MSAIHVAIVEDNNALIRIIKEKLSFFPDISIPFTASDGLECLNKLKLGIKVDLILMDIEMPIMGGIETTKNIVSSYPDIKILMLTVFDDDDHLFQAICSGAKGYLLKEVNPEDLHRGITQIMGGGAAMSPSIALKTIHLLQAANTKQSNVSKDFFSLTPREIEILHHLASGAPYTIIAKSLFISPSTVRKHIENIYSKLQVHSKTEAVLLAKKNQLI